MWCSRSTTSPSRRWGRPCWPSWRGRRGGAGGGWRGLMGRGSSWAALPAFSLCIFVPVPIGRESARGASARRAIAGGSWPRALRDLVSRNRRRYGGYIVHLAVVLLVVGIAASGAYRSVNEAPLHRGDPMRVGGYTLPYPRLHPSRHP